MTEAIRTQGLREFNRAIKAVDRDLPKAVRMALNDCADLVVRPAKADVPSRSGKAARSIRAASTQSKARVRGGGRRAPYLPWLDFGGRVGRNRSVRRRYTKDGRYIYPNYRRLRDSGRFTDVMVEGLVDVARKAGLEVRS